MFEILRNYTELVEPVSIDEGYLDITDSFELGSPIEIAQSIQKRVLEQLDLPCSIGIAPNKFLAKTASDMKKPLGITILRKRDIPSVLWPLNTSEMHGVGKKTAEKLTTIGIHTIGELAAGNEIQLKSLLGINGIRIKERANGIDNRAVDPESVSDFKSIGNSTTLPKDTSNQQELFRVLESLADTVSVRLKRKNVLATTLGITIRFKDRKTITRSKKLTNPIQQKEDIASMAKQIFIKEWNGNPVRLLGITGYDLVEQDLAFKQLDLFSFEKDAKKEPLLKTLSTLRDKYGENIIENAGTRTVNNAHNVGTGTSFNKDFLRTFPQKKKEDY
jgi:DNA polymerase-4